jgi:hypothetical protein
MHRTSPPTRRRFLQHAAGTAVMASLAGIVGESSAGEQKPAKQDSSSAAPTRAFHAGLRNGSADFGNRPDLLRPSGP